MSLPAGFTTSTDTAGRNQTSTCASATGHNETHAPTASTDRTGPDGSPLHP